MKMLLGLLGIMAFFGSCKAPRESGTAGQAATVQTRTRLQPAKGNDAGQVNITGTEVVPILGRSETGVRDDLEGTWVLQRIEGISIADKSNVNTSLTGKKDSLKNSSSTIVTNGQTTTETIYEKSNATEKKITPPQGSSYHIPAKPSISFFGSNETFTGFTGCNKLSGRYRLTGRNNISFQQPAPSTKMVCIGDYDEQTFINALQKVNAYNAANGQLQLLSGTKVILQFSRK